MFNVYLLDCDTKISIIFELHNISKKKFTKKVEISPHSPYGYIRTLPDYFLKKFIREFIPTMALLRAMSYPP